MQRARRKPAIRTQRAMLSMIDGQKGPGRSPEKIETEKEQESELGNKSETCYETTGFWPTPGPNKETIAFSYQWSPTFYFGKSRVLESM